MNRFLLTILLLSPLISWGEDNVWICVEDQSYGLEEEDTDGIFKLEHYPLRRFTLEYEPDKNRAAFAGGFFSSDKDDPLYADCIICMSEPQTFFLSTLNIMFTMTKSRFLYTKILAENASMAAGTCAKF